MQGKWILLESIFNWIFTQSQNKPMIWEVRGDLTNDALGWLPWLLMDCSVGAGQMAQRLGTLATLALVSSPVPRNHADWEYPVSPALDDPLVASVGTQRLWHTQGHGDRSESYAVYIFYLILMKSNCRLEFWVDYLLGCSLHMQEEIEDLGNNIVRHNQCWGNSINKFVSSRMLVHNTASEKLVWEHKWIKTLKMSQACLLYLESRAVNTFAHQAGGSAFSGLSSGVVQDLHCVTE